MGDESGSKMVDHDTPIVRAHVIHPLIAGHVRRTAPDIRLEEAVGLAIALDMEVVGAEILPVRQIRAGSYLGSGKLAELKEGLEAAETDVLVIDDTLSPVQQRNLEQALGVKVVDRTGLILEIFARRARTKEGVLQVELARQTYERSRLVRTWTHLERQRGGTGKTGGPGERQLELDRRILADKIGRLKADLENVRRTRALARAGRKRKPWPVIALVGYTNAGKSSLFNAITSAEVFAKDMVFATLDTTLRAIDLKPNGQALLSDTVGFISDLPPELVAAFRATLEEVAEADLIVHVRDIASPDTGAQADDVRDILARLFEENSQNGDDYHFVPMIEAWNKADLLDEDEMATLEARSLASMRFLGQRHGQALRGYAAEDLADVPAFLVSAVTGYGLDRMLGEIGKLIAPEMDSYHIVLAPHQGAARAFLYQHGQVEKEDMGEGGDIEMDVRLSTTAHGRYLGLFG